MELETGRPLSGARLARLKAFLADCGLDYDAGVDYTAMLTQDGEIVASGSLDGSTIKCVAVRPDRQGEDLCARVLTELRREAFSRGLKRLMLFTKPANEAMFQNFGFYRVLRTGDCLLMEDKRDGLADYIASLARAPSDDCGCVVANCNPFTLGHRYLIETAAGACGYLHLFILSEERGPFSAADRLALARAGCADLKNVIVHPGGPYLISSATFPAYFIRDKARVDEIFCEMDIRLFAERIAPALGIARRFVGCEPIDRVTRLYNEALKASLPKYGIELCELARLEIGGEVVSASRVRARFEARDFEALRPLVPQSTYDYLLRKAGGR